MARISTYPVEPNPDGSDILLGTDASGGGNATKNFRISDISTASVNKYLANNSWKFMTDAYNAPSTKSSLYFAAGGGDGTAWSAITTLRLQTLMGNNSISEPYLEYLLTGSPTGGLSGNTIVTIVDRNDLSSFGVFNFSVLTNVDGHVYDIVLGFVKGNGSIQEGHIYGIELDASAGVNTFEYSQVAPATVWNVTHNLGKFPSITVIDTGDTVVVGEYQYINNNTVTLTFSAAFAGKAYLN
jgi:hypothetical protein